MYGISSTRSNMIIAAVVPLVPPLSFRTLLTHASSLPYLYESVASPSSSSLSSSSSLFKRRHPLSNEAITDRGVAMYENEEMTPEALSHTDGFRVIV
jgi:hypothetical protein